MTKINIKINKTQMCKLVADHLDTLDIIAPVPVCRKSYFKCIDRACYTYKWYTDYEFVATLGYVFGKPYLRFYVYDFDDLLEEKFVYLDRELMLSRGILQEVAA